MRNQKPVFTGPPHAEAKAGTRDFVYRHAQQNGFQVSEKWLLPHEGVMTLHGRDGDMFAEIHLTFDSTTQHIMILRTGEELDRFGRIKNRKGWREPKERDFYIPFDAQRHPWKEHFITAFLSMVRSEAQRFEDDYEKFFGDGIAVLEGQPEQTVIVEREGVFLAVVPPSDDTGQLAWVYPTRGIERFDDYLSLDEAEVDRDRGECVNSLDDLNNLLVRMAEAEAEAASAPSMD